MSLVSVFDFDIGIWFRFGLGLRVRRGIAVWRLPTRLFILARRTSKIAVKGQRRTLFIHLFPGWMNFTLVALFNGTHNKADLWNLYIPMLFIYLWV